MNTMEESIEKNISDQNEEISEEQMKSWAGKLYQALSDIGKSKNISVSVKKDSIGTFHPQFIFWDQTVHVYIQSAGGKVWDIEWRETKYQVTLEDIIRVPEYKEALAESWINYYISGWMRLQDLLDKYKENNDLWMIDMNTIKKELNVSGTETDSYNFRLLMDKYCNILNGFLSNWIISSKVHKEWWFEIDISVIGKENLDNLIKDTSILEKNIKNIISSKNKIESQINILVEEYKIKKNDKENIKKNTINDKKKEL